MKPLFEEGDFVYFLEPGKEENRVYIVYKTEDFSYDYTFPTAVGAGTLSNFVTIDNLEPKQINSGEDNIQMYQVRAGVDVGMMYTEMLSGAIRNTVYKIRRASTTVPYVGWFDEVMSPYNAPAYEFYLRYNEKPGFAVYNPWGFTITPNMAFRGRKMQLMNVLKDETGKIMGMTKAELEQIYKLVRSGKIQHRRLTVYGMED